MERKSRDLLILLIAISACVISLLAGQLVLMISTLVLALAYSTLSTLKLGLSLEAVTKEKEQALSNKAEAESQAALKSRFLANMSHEIRTPLNGINGMLYLLSQTSISTEQKDLLRIAQSSSDHLINLVNMILDYSKLQVHKMKLRLEPTPLRSKLEDLIEMFRFQAREKDLRLKLELPEELTEDTYYALDAVRLQQVLINLLNNALKYTDHGYIQLKVEIVKDYNGQDRLYFEVRDTGPGMSKEQQNHLFKAFEQGQHKRNRNSGTGLGLSISKSLVDLMGGKLYLESKESLGSRFYFSLALQPLSRPEEENFKSSEAIESLKGLRVLLAEDNAVNFQVAMRVLHNFGAEVFWAKDGLEALELFATGDFDVILMDVEMPLLNGVEASKRIRESSKYRIKPVPILALSARSVDEIQDQSVSNLFDGLIPKPFKIESIQLILRRFVNQD